MKKEYNFEPTFEGFVEFMATQKAHGRDYDFYDHFDFFGYLNKYKEHVETILWLLDNNANYKLDDNDLKYPPFKEVDKRYSFSNLANFIAFKEKTPKHLNDFYGDPVLTLHEFKKYIDSISP